ncbi:MAG TPA: hypothetical protein VGO87_15360 [Acidimicrobiia bacterium]|jgi:hypothetical protein
MPTDQMHDTDFLTLHCLTLAQMATPEKIRTIVGVAEADAEAALARLVETGDVKAAKGRYVIMPAGRQRLDAIYPELFGSVRSTDKFTGAYERFEKINQDLKALITQWQTMTVEGKSVPNDHSDADYDAKIIDRLADLHERAEPILDDFAAVIARLGRYKARLTEALDKVDAGETDYVSSVRLDSYHTVWFELHEDLLRILGTTRDE